MEEFDLERGEYVVQTIRVHWFVLVMKLIPLVVLALLPVFVMAALGTVASRGIIGNGADILPLIGTTASFAAGIWWLFLWMAAFSLITKYFLTVWVITNTRIVDISQETFFSRRVSSFLLARVQDVTTDVDGLLATIIGFGKINVQTAGMDDSFSVDNIPHPQDVRDLIMAQVAALQQGTPRPSLDAV